MLRRTPPLWIDGCLCGLKVNSKTCCVSCSNSSAPLRLPRIENENPRCLLQQRCEIEVAAARIADAECTMLRSGSSRKTQFSSVSGSYPLGPGRKRVERAESISNLGVSLVAVTSTVITLSQSCKPCAVWRKTRMTNCSRYVRTARGAKRIRIESSRWPAKRSRLCPGVALSATMLSSEGSSSVRLHHEAEATLRIRIEEVHAQRCIADRPNAPSQIDGILPAAYGTIALQLRTDV